MHITQTTDQIYKEETDGVAGGRQAPARPAGYYGLWGTRWLWAAAREVNRQVEAPRAPRVKVLLHRYEPSILGLVSHEARDTVSTFMSSSYKLCII